MQPADEAASEQVRLEAVVHGRVQGVGYRYFVLRKAAELELVGWVANEADGSVRCIAEGPKAALDGLLTALHDGPRGAVVSSIAEDWLPATGQFGDFGVRSSGHRGD